jgi:integrase
LDHKRVRPLTPIRFDELVPLFFEHRSTERAETTVVGERNKSQVLLRHFKSRRVEQITAADVTRYRNLRKNAEIANRTINLELTLLRCLFRFAVEQGYAVHNPGKEVRNLPETRTDRPIPSPEQLVRFIDDARKTKTGNQLVVWLKLRALTGMRPRESFHLSWPDLDFEQCQIYIRPKNGNSLKNRRFRVIEMHPDLKHTLLEWRKEWEKKFQGRGRPHEWVFFHPFHPEKRAKSFVKAFSNARETAGLPNFRPYDLRHYFISHAIMSGVEMFTVAKWAGHRNTKMIEEVYGHLSPEYRAAQMLKLDIKLGNGTGAEPSQTGQRT